MGRKPKGSVVKAAGEIEIIPPLKPKTPSDVMESRVRNMVEEVFSVNCRNGTLPSTGAIDEIVKRVRYMYERLESAS